MAPRYSFGSSGSRGSVFGATGGAESPFAARRAALRSALPEADDASTDGIDNNQMLNAIARMIYSGDEKLANQARTSLKNNRHRFQKAELEQYGLANEVPKDDDRNLFEKAVGGGVSALQTAGNVIGRFGQTSAKALNTVGTAAGGVAGVAINRATGALDDYEDVTLGDVAGKTVDNTARTWRSPFDISGSEDINAREMANIDKNAGGSGWFGDYVIGGLDTAAMMAVDPLSWVGPGGAVEATKAGMAAVAAELGDDVAKQVAKKGAKAVLSEDDIARVQARLVKNAEEVGGRAADQRGRVMSKVFGEGDKRFGPIRQLKDNAVADTAGELGIPMKGLSGAERAAARNVNSMVARGQSGAKMFGKTVAGRDTLRAPLVKAGLFGEEITTAVPKVAKAPAVVGPATDLGDGSSELVAMIDDAPAGSVNYRVDENGVVQIEGIVTLPGHERKGVASQLIGEVEKATGQPRTAFGPGEGVEPGAEGFWNSLQSPATTDITQTATPTRALGRAGARVKRGLQDAFVTGAPVARKQGREVAEGIKAAHETAAGTKSAAMADTRNVLVNAIGKAMDESKTFADEAKDVIYPAMERTGAAIEHADAPALRQAVEEATQRIVTLREEALSLRRSIDRMGANVSPATRFSAQQREAALAQRIADAEQALGDTTAQLDSLPQETLSGAEELAQKWDAAGRPAAAEAVRTLDRLRTEYTKTLEQAGLLPEELQHAQQEYMRRLLTKDGEAIIKEVNEGRRAGVHGDKPNELARNMAQGGATEARVLAPEADVQTANKLARGLFGMSEDEDFFRSDPFLSVGRRANEAEQALAEQRFLEEVKGITGLDGAPVLRDAPQPGDVEIPTRTGTLYAPPEIADEVSRFQDIVLNDKALAAWEKGMDRVMRTWKAYATVPLIGAAFHMRNGQTNMMLNWIAGMGASDLGYYARAGKLQGKLTDAERLIGTKGKDGEVLDMAGALRKAGVDETDIKRVLMARDDNVLGASYFRQDLAVEDSNPLLMPSAATRAKAAVNPTNLNNAAIKSGRFVGSKIEDNARLAHYLWALDKYGDRAAAAMSVKKYLFNYEDLTAFEKKVMKRTIPFYTFMRKNTALMTRTLAENPGKLSRASYLEQQTQDSDNPLLAGQALPGYAAREGQMQRTFMPGNIIGSVESPWSAAVDTAKPFVSGAAMLPGVEKIAPDELKDERGIQGVATDLLNMPGGPTAEFAKSVIKYATGKDTFTGADVNPWQESGADRAFEVASWFAPAPEKMRSVTEAMRGGKRRNKKGNDPDAQRRAAIIKMVLGLNTTAYDDRSTTAENIGRFMDLDTALRQYNAGKEPVPDDATLEEALAAGRVPTLDQLREGGLIPEPPSTSRRRRGSASNPFGR